MNSNDIANKQIEMKKIINRIYDFSLKLNGTININSVNDAANLSAIVLGHNSWKDYKDSIKIELQTNKNTSIKKKKIFNTINYQPEIVDFNLLKKRQYKNYELKLNLTVPKELLVGKHTKKNQKTVEPKAILPEDLLVTSNKNKVLNNTYHNQINWLLEKNQPIIIFGDTNGISNKNVKVIGESNLTINPIEDLLESDGLEMYLEISSDEEVGSFPWIFSMLIRNIQEVYGATFNVKELLEFTKLEYLINILKTWESNHTYIKKVIEAYVLKKCNISFSNNKYIISEESFKIHYDESYIIENKLKELDNLYHDNIFSYNPDVSITEIIYKKESAYFIRNTNKNYMDLLSILYLKSYQKHYKELLNLNPDNYKVWTIFYDAEVWINSNVANAYANIKNSINTYYVSSNFNHLSPILNKVSQILMFNQNIDGYDNSWKNKMLSYTINYDINFWYNDKEVLTKLKENEAILWTSQNRKTTDIELNDYEINKIDLYENFK